MGRIVLFIFLICINNSGFAAISKPIRDVDKLYKATIEEAVRVKTAGVVLADYDLIKQDIPQFVDLLDYDIDPWILKHVVMSTYQYKKGVEAGVNTPIDVDLNQILKAYRPTGYGRALVVSTDNGFLLDQKGAGTESPTKGLHKNGLATLSECIQEFILEKLIQKVFTHSGSEFQTIGTYAVIDLGFMVNDPVDGVVPAGMVLRQAYPRENGGFEYIDPKSNLLDHGIEVERVLRRYGISSAGEYFLKKSPTKRFINVQKATNGAVVDFGSYIVLEDFDQSLWWMNRYKPVVKTEKLLLDVSGDQFIHPDPSLQVPVKLLGVEKKNGIWIDHISQWADSWSKRIRENKNERVHLKKELKDIFLTIERRWRDSDRQKASELPASPLSPALSGI